MLCGFLLKNGLGWKKTSSWVIFIHVKRLFLTFMICALLLSCQSGNVRRYGYGDGRTPEEIQLSLEILLADTYDTAPGLISVSREELGALLPPVLDEYRDTLPLYDVLESAYLDSLEKGMKDAVERAISIFEEMDMEIPYTYDYINEKTLTSLLAELHASRVKETIASEIDILFPELDSSWERLSRECRVLKKNYENLQSVTDMVTLSEPEPIGDGTLADFIVKKALDAMLFGEEYLRNRPMSDHSERSYQIFWED